MISFARGVPAPECLAVDELADCARAAVELDGRTVLSYGPGGGYGPLRELLAERFAAGLRLPRRAARPPRHSRPRGVAHLRPAAQDPDPARRGDRRRADGRGRAD